MIRGIFKFYNLWLSPNKDLANRIKQIVGFTPNRMLIFRQAFSHKSNQRALAKGLQSNERLEYLGDAILGTIVAEYLFKKYPNGDEGFLTKMRSKIVKRKSLNEIADKMGLDILLSEYNNTKLSKSMLGNALEALVGAVYLDAGYHKTRKFIVKKILRKYLDIHQLEHVDDNYKSQLLEYCQKKGAQVSYKVIARYKLDKRDRFKVAVFVDSEKVATADDYNKKSAEQAASQKAIKSLGLLDVSAV